MQSFFQENSQLHLFILIFFKLLKYPLAVLRRAIPYTEMGYGYAMAVSYFWMHYPFASQSIPKPYYRIHNYI